MIIFFSVPLIISGLPMEPPVEAVPSPVSSVPCPTQDFDCNSCLDVEGCFYVEHKVKYSNHYVLSFKYQNVHKMIVTSANF